MGFPISQTDRQIENIRLIKVSMKVPKGTVFINILLLFERRKV